MNMIVAVDKNWAIGKNNDLLIKIPEDMKYFKTLTYGKVVVMGRNTLESLPAGKPLEGRKNLVLSKEYDNTEAYSNLKVFRSVEDILEHVRVNYNTEDVFIIGGRSVYEQFLPFCDKVYVTYIEYEFESPDVYFPTRLDLEQDEWRCTHISLLKKYSIPIEEKFSPSFITSGMELEEKKQSFITYRYQFVEYTHQHKNTIN